MIQIFGTAKCTNTRAAQRFFADRKIKVQFIELREKAMSKGELASVARAVGGMKMLYASDSAHVKARGLQYSNPNEIRIAELLEKDALLLRTPIVREGARAAVGLAEAQWKTFLPKRD
jgi:arsenate reductase (glutaredoxin)